PRFLALAYTVGIVGVVVSFLSTLRGPSQGCLAGLVLLGSHFLAEKGIMQYADIPLTFYLVTTLALLCYYDTSASRPTGALVLAGLSAGCAAWTKNEGQLFLVCLCAARLLVLLSGRGWRSCLKQTAVFGLGLAPFLACLVYFKSHYATEND